MNVYFCISMGKEEAECRVMTLQESNKEDYAVTEMTAKELIYEWLFSISTS